MKMPTILQTAEDLEYPSTDGKPMAENTLQFQWIVTIHGNLDGLYLEGSNVFVAGDHFWYPVQGAPTIRVAPDVFVVFGRPKGHRSSYRQWREGGIAPQVTFEIRSPGNDDEEMDLKFEFYERYGVEEYYLFDPDNGDLQGWRRSGRKLLPIPNMDGWVSPRLGIKFDLSGSELVILRPDGQRFLTFAELMERKAQAERAAADAARAVTQAERAAADAARAVTQAERAAADAASAVTQAERATQQAQQRAERLAAQLRALGIEPSE
jgi:Uma2 family endonuclease